MKNEDYSKKIEIFKKKGNNIKCFECNQKGTTYVCLSFGTFVCSGCAGILSNLNYKVKGLGVATFNKNDYEFIIQNGNDKAKNKWLTNFDPNKDKYPNIKDYEDIRKFIINKYQFKKYCLDENMNDKNFNINKNKNSNKESKNLINQPKSNSNQNLKGNKNDNILDDFIFGGNNQIINNNNNQNNNNNNDINDLFNFNSNKSII